MPMRWFNVDVKLGVPTLTLTEDDWLKATVPDKQTSLESFLELSEEKHKDMINLGQELLQTFFDEFAKTPAPEK